MTNKPHVILFRGFPGVGKSHYSSLAAEKFNLAIFRKDDIYDLIFDDVGTHQRRNEISYSIIYRQIDTNLKARTSIIVDYPFKEHKYLNQLSEFIKERNGILKSILCTCSDRELWKNRFENRDMYPNNLIRKFDELERHYQTLYLERFNDELVIDTKEDSGMLMKKIENYVFSNMTQTL